MGDMHVCTQNIALIDEDMNLLWTWNHKWEPHGDAVAELREASNSWGLGMFQTSQPGDDGWRDLLLMHTDANMSHVAIGSV